VVTSSRGQWNAISPLVEYSTRHTLQRTHRLLWFLSFAAFSEQSHLLRSSSSFTHRTHTCGELTAADVSSRVTVCGWLQHLRHSGLFLVLRDAHGIVQAVVANPEVTVDFQVHQTFQVFIRYVLIELDKLPVNHMVKFKDASSCTGSGPVMHPD